MLSVEMSISSLGLAPPFEEPEAAAMLCREPSQCGPAHAELSPVPPAPVVWTAIPDRECGCSGSVEGCH
jgi:hypothetical protein